MNLAEHRGHVSAPRVSTGSNGSMKPWYLVLVRGCDDATCIKVELTDAEALIVGRIAREITKASWNDCQPVMDIVLYDNASDGDKEALELMTLEE